MSLLDVSGVVLNRRDVREDSRLYIVYTHERGKVEVFGRGIRKGSAKLGGHLEPGATVRLTLAQGKSGETITAVERDHYPAATMQSLSRLASLGFVLGLVDALTKTEAADPALATFLQESVNIIEAFAEPSNHFARFRMWFAWHVLGLTGVGPELDRCVHCRRALPQTHVTFSALLGGWLGPECKSADADATAAPGAAGQDADATVVSATVRDCVHVLVRGSWAEAFAYVATPGTEQVAARLTRSALDHALERRLPAERFVAFVRTLSVPYTA
ncbi:MAG: DNA repair protein RecO [Patescibacteria group bacterium]